MKRLFSFLLVLILATVFLPCQAEEKYSKTIFGYFDTVVSFMGYTDSQESFDAVCEELTREMKYLHQLFDGYNSYPGQHNLWYVNHHAGEAPVKVDDVLFDLLQKCQALQKTPGYEKVNVAMGTVLSLWHNAREEGALPDRTALQAATQHTDFSKIILNEEEKTVFFADPKIRLDLGAVAKGYAADRLKAVVEDKMPSFLISLGGNVYAGDAPLDGRKKWGVSVQCPDGVAPIQFGGDMLDVFYVNRMSLVTSGDYQRYMEIDGKRYHHIIDPDTCMPANHLRAVTIVCENGFLADYLSTLLFLLPYEEGVTLIESIPDAGALFVLADGSVTMTENLHAIAYSHGATAR